MHHKTVETMSSGFQVTENRAREQRVLKIVMPKLFEIVDTIVT